MAAPLLDCIGGSNEVSCSFCMDCGWETVLSGGTRYVRRCRCSGPNHLSQYLNQAQIPARFGGCDLTSYQALTPEQRLAKVIAEQFVADFSTHGLGLVIYGESGVGKTHLAASILHELMVRYRVRGVFCGVPEMMRLYGRTQGLFGRMRVYSKQERIDHVTRLEQADILLLDDLGPVSPSRKFQDALDYLFGIRYASMRPVIITTEVPPFTEREGAVSLEERLGVATVSRLRQMCRFFRLVGCDLRLVLGSETAVQARMM